MSDVQRQVLLEAPVTDIWALLGNPRRYPEWWPRVIDVQGGRFEEGDEYVQVTRSPTGRQETTWLLDQVDDLREIRMHCTASGTYAHWRLTDAQGETFVDVRLGIDPEGIADRVWDRALGRRFFRRWIDDSIDGLTTASGPRLR